MAQAGAIIKPGLAGPAIADLKKETSDTAATFHLENLCLDYIVAFWVVAKQAAGCGALHPSRWCGPSISRSVEERTGAA